MIHLPSPEHVSVDLLRVDSRNPNRMSDEQLSAVVKNIEKFGFIVPVVLNKDGVIIDGHHRYLAAKQLGMKEVLAVRLDLEDVDARMLQQVLNKLRGEHLPELDEDVYRDILSRDRINEFEELIARPKEDILKLLDRRDVREDDDFDLDEALERAESRCEVGQLWKLGNHLLYCGDSTKTETYKKLLGEIKADLLLTDPPYGVNYVGKTKDSLKIQNDSHTDCFGQALSLAPLIPGGAAYVFAPPGDNFQKFTAAFVSRCHHAGTLIWLKNSMVLGHADYHYKHEPIIYGWEASGKHRFFGGRNQTTVWEVDRPSRSKEHPTMKPLALLRKAILNSSLANEIVLDPFGGSGSTLIACEQTLRQCRMVELDPRYADVILYRWERYTSLKAELTQ